MQTLEQGKRLIAGPWARSRSQMSVLDVRSLENPAVQDMLQLQSDEAIPANPVTSRLKEHRFRRYM